MEWSDTHSLIRRFLLHRIVTKQGFSSPNDNLGSCTTKMYPQKIE
jgi:hypothetical protein